MFQVNRYVNGGTYKLMIASLGDKVIVGEQDGHVENKHITYKNVRWEDGTPIIQTEDNRTCFVTVNVEDIICMVRTDD